MPFRDVVILLPGITGSTLTKDGKVLWGADVGGLMSAVISGGDTVRQLALTHGDDPEEDDIDGVVATSLIPDLHLIPGLWKIDGYTKVAKFLQAKLGLVDGQNFFSFPYDWRRDNRVASRKLAAFVRPRLKRWRDAGSQDAKVIFVVHSMGGLVARGYIDGLEGWRDTRALVTLGTPHRGSLNALGFLANGFAKSIGPFKLDFTDVARSFTGLYQLLPQFACVDAGAGMVHVHEANIPNIDRTRAADAAAFYAKLDSDRADNMKITAYQDEGPTWFPVVGTFQTTMLSARQAGGHLSVLPTHPDSNAGTDGDGTVPRVSAMSAKSSPMYVEQVHASLQNDDGVLKHVVSLIEGTTYDPGQLRGDFAVDLDIDDLYSASEPVVLRARTNAGGATLRATVHDAAIPAEVENAPVIAVVDLRRKDETFVGKCDLAPGAYRLLVRAAEGLPPTADCFVVADAG
jgi:hypothetical protein